MTPFTSNQQPRPVSARSMSLLQSDRSSRVAGVAASGVIRPRGIDDGARPYSPLSSLPGSEQNQNISSMRRGLTLTIRYLPYDAISEHSRAKMEPTNLCRSRFPTAGAGAWLGPGATLIHTHPGQ
jgi:hypothetical protein